MFYKIPGQPQNSRPHDPRFDPPAGWGGCACWLLYAVGIGVMISSVAGACGILLSRM